MLSRKLFGKVGDEHNHCAHFVSHALGFRIGKLCNQMDWKHRKDTDAGRSLVVNDIFNECPERGYWRDEQRRQMRKSVFIQKAMPPSGSGCTQNCKCFRYSPSEFHARNVAFC